MFQKNSKVIELTTKDFVDKKIKNTKQKGIILFGAPWCGYCVRTAPEFEKASKLMGNNYRFYYIDASKEKEIARRFKITGFPTIKYVDASGVIYKDFSGDRSSKSFLDNICTESSICKK